MTKERLPKKSPFIHIFYSVFNIPSLLPTEKRILLPQTKILSSLVHKKMYSIKNYPLTLNAKNSCKIYTLSRKIFAPSPIPNGKGHFLSLFQKFFCKKNSACHKADDQLREYFTKLYSLLQKKSLFEIE